MQDEVREKLLDTYMRAVKDNKELRDAIGSCRSVHSVKASRSLVDAKRLLGRMGIKTFEGRSFIFFVADIETFDGAGFGIDEQLPVFVAFPPQPGQVAAWDRCAAAF